MSFKSRVLRVLLFENLLGASVSLCFATGEGLETTYKILDPLKIFHNFFRSMSKVDDTLDSPFPFTVPTSSSMIFVYEGSSSRRESLRREESGEDCSHRKL